MTEIPITEEILLSIPQVAALIHCDKNRVRSYVRSGKLKALRLGEIKVRREEVDRFLRENEGFDLKDPNNVKELDYESI